jgi:DNA polymerase-3 subunit epsilon
MKRSEYAIVDIETTGGNARDSRITEIAILIHDGTTITKRFETLINPQKEIPAPIFALTGIDNEMVRHAPIFDDVAEQILSLLTDRIFVAHNVNFDYTFVRHELEKSGFKWSAVKLCTVRAARKIKPGLASYSLGRLCTALDIPLYHQHRAGGDADATAILFSRLLQWDDQGVLNGMIKKTAQDQRLPPNLPQEDFTKLPEKPGVYYFYDKGKKVIYVGKALNLKKRVSSHFSGHKITPQRQHFLRDIYGISFEVCGTELMAFLLECSEIKQLWPKYNKALKRFEAKYGLYTYEARNGYTYLATGKVTKFQTCIELFNNQQEGLNMLLDISQKFEIDYRFCKYCSPGADIIFNTDSSELPDLDAHNNKVSEAITYVLDNRPSFAIIDKGRSPDEKSCIWIQDGHFYGMGYIPSDTGFSAPDEIRSYLTPCRSNHYIMQLIYSYALKHPSKVFFRKNW